MQIATAIADYDYYKNSRADKAAITARERKKTETRPRRYVAARLVGCLSVSSPLSPPPLGFSLRLLVVSFMSSTFLLRRHLAFCQLASFLISLCHQKQKRKFYFFFVLSCCFFESPPPPYYSRQDFHCRCSHSPLLPFIYRWWCKINKRPTFVIDFSKGTRLAMCFDYSHTHTHWGICVSACVCWYACTYGIHFVFSSYSSRPLHFWLRLFAFLICSYARSPSLCRYCSPSSFVYVSTHICCCNEQRHWQRYRHRDVGSAVDSRER